MSLRWGNHIFSDFSFCSDGLLCWDLILLIQAQLYSCHLVTSKIVFKNILNSWSETTTIVVISKTGHVIELVPIGYIICTVLHCFTLFYIDCIVLHQLHCLHCFTLITMFYIIWHCFTLFTLFVLFYNNYIICFVLHSLHCFTLF